MNIQSMQLSSLKAAPWRFSEDRSLGQSQYENPTPIIENIVHSLEKHGQLAPIHVRPLEMGEFEIIDGHLVVEAARQAGLQTLDAVYHLVDDQTALSLYILFNLNRGGQYGHRHVKIMRMFQEYCKGGSTATELAALTAWPLSRVQDYLAIDERGKSWKRFMFATNDAGEFSHGALFEVEEEVAKDF